MTRRNILIALSVLLLLGGLLVVPGYLTPESDATTLADIDRRLKALETTQRVGLSRMRSAWGDDVSYTLTATNTWLDGTAEGATWTDDQGNTGSGFPEVTVTTGRRVLIVATARANKVSALATNKSNLMRIGVSIDGDTPASASTSGAAATYATLEVPGNDAVNGHVTLITQRVDLEPGEHTIALQAFANNYRPGASDYAEVLEVQLTVIPLD